MNVFACEPEWGALVEQLAGDRVDVDVATTAFQDVHYIQARPSLISRARRADLVVCSGAQLEIGWLPLLLRQSTNQKVMPGQPGYVETALLVPRLEVPTVVDRSAGDLHPFGNPHVQVDPANIARIAGALAEKLASLDPAGAETYRTRNRDFQERWTAAMKKWQQKAQPLHGMRVVVHHSSWIYMADWLDLDIVGYLEPKPGLPPTSGHLAELLNNLQQRPPAAIIRSVYQSARASRWLSERIDAPAVVLPHTVGATEDAVDLFSLFDAIIDRLLAAKNAS